MNTKHFNCHVCNAPIIRRVARSIKSKIHFCSIDCKAQHQRNAKPVTRDWLVEHYVTKQMDCTQIAHIVKRDPKSVWNWLKDLEIATRPRGNSLCKQNFKAGGVSPMLGRKHSQATKDRIREIAIATGRVPYDPKVGSYMKGKKGSETTNWKGGCTPERQSFYSSDEWKECVKAVWKRDDAKCQRCGLDCRTLQKDERKFAIHHIVSFRVRELRAVVSNLVLVCRQCHLFIHSRKNIKKEFLK